MQIHSDGKLVCQIAADRSLSYRIGWFFTAENGETGPINLQKCAENWAGGPGAPFRVPDDDGRAVELPEVRIETLDIVMIDPEHCEVCLHGRRLGLELESAASGFTEYFDRDGGHRKRAKFKVTGADPAALFPAVGDPVDWAGEDFICEALQLTNLAGDDWEVAVEARKVVTRMLDCVRSENFAGFDRAGLPRRNITYRSRWLVRAADLASFELLSGSGAPWAAADAMLTAVMPKALSAGEYEVEMEAQAFGNPDLFRRYGGDDRSNLAGRVDVSAELCDFLITPEMAGYVAHPSGGWMPDPNWDGTRSCPFAATAALDPNMVNAVAKTVILTERRHRAGTLDHNLDYLTDWAAGPRLFDGSVGGIPGPFLKIDLDSEEVFDNLGMRWTRFTGKYQMAPGSFAWNPDYWTGK
jgi:hypothetical protein